MNTKMSYYEKVAEKLLKGQPRPKPYGKLIGNRFLTGTQSLHKTRQSVKWRMFWRLKTNRKPNI